MKSDKKSNVARQVMGRSFLYSIATIQEFGVNEVIEIGQEGLIILEKSNQKLFNKKC